MDMDIGVPADYYIYELILELLLFMLLLPLWGSDGFQSASDRRTSGVTESAFASSTIDLTYFDLAVMLRQFLFIILSRVMLATRYVLCFIPGQNKTLESVVVLPYQVWHPKVHSISKTHIKNLTPKSKMTRGILHKLTNASGIWRMPKHSRTVVPLRCGRCIVIMR